MRYNADDRGQRYCDIFPEIGKGDINVTIIEPLATALWHRHKYQSDYQLVVKGALKIGMCNLPNSAYSAIEVKNDQKVMLLDRKMDKMQKEWANEYRSYSMDALYKQHDIENDIENKYDSDRDWPVGIENRWPVHESKVEWHYLSERNANEGPLYIPPGIWHGCHNYTNEQAILIYHITNKYDGTDEDRCSVEDMKWPVEREAK
jgi:quercetin dioxygenase-like cupin family protein